MKNNTFQYTTWSLSVRWFHWINVLSVIGLILLGLLMIYKKDLGINSLEAKIALKQLHVIIGYVFATNLLIRLIFGFIGPTSARFSAFIPGKGFISELKSYKQSIKSGHIQQFIGHNPLGKLAITSAFFLLIILSVTGLIRAGTDIYFPPFGSSVTQYLAMEGVEPESIKPYQDQGVDLQKKAELKAFKGPIGKIHVYSAYTLMLFIILHVFSVVRAEVKENDPLVSSMISGKKRLSQQALDE